MSNLDKIYELNLDLVYKVQNDEMEFSLNDIDTSMFYVTFTRNKKDVLNLRGKSVVFYVIKPNGNAMYTNLQYDLAQEKFYCELPNNFKNVLGDYIGQVVVYDSETEERIVIPTRISYKITSDILDATSSGVDEEEQVTILESLMADISSWSGKIDEAVNKANESINLVDGVKQIALTNQSDISSLNKDVDTLNANVDTLSSEIDTLENNKADKSSIPTKVSQLSNDVEYVTSTELNEMLGDIDLDIDLSEYVTKTDINNLHPVVKSTDELYALNTKNISDGTLAFVTEDKTYFSYTAKDGWEELKAQGEGGTGVVSAFLSSPDSENITVQTGSDLTLNLDFYSPNIGRGTLKVLVNDVDVMSATISQGESANVISRDYLSKGTNEVSVYVIDRTGVLTNVLVFYVRYGSTEITTTFDPYSAYDYNSIVRFYFTVSALITSDELFMYMNIDGTTYSPVSCKSDVRGYFTFPSDLSVGAHYCEAWATDSSGKSNILKFNLIILDNTSLVVASDTKSVTVEEGSQVSLDYKVYMKGNTSFITKTYVDNQLISTGTCGLTTNYYKTTSLSEGIHTVKVEVWDVTETVSDYVTWTININESTYDMKQPIQAGALFIGSAKNKTNSDANRTVWVGKDQDNNDVNATLYNFAFNDESGWMNDSLLITGNSYVEVPVAPLSSNAKYGFTLDIEFSTKPIGVDNAEVLTLWNDTDNCGVKITTEELILQSKEGNSCRLYFGEEENISAIFVIDRDEGFAKIYINGVMCEGFHLSDYTANGVDYLEDFTVESNIYLGGKDTNGHSIIRNLRVYEVALATDEILNNFISNEINKEAQKELVNFQKGDTLPTLTVYCDFSGLGKDDKKPCSITYLSPDVTKYGESFTLSHKKSQLQYQGTSSMAYPIKNYRLNLRDAEGNKWKYNPFPDGKGEARFTLKADFMSSGHWQNTGMAKFVNDCLYHYDTSDEKSMNPMKWYSINNGGKLSDTRETINGFPCRLILVNDGTTPLNEGQAEPTSGNTKDMGIFNFNNDKDNVSTFGLDNKIFPNCMSYEVTANSDTSAGAFIPFTPNIEYFLNSSNNTICTVFLPKDMIYSNDVTTLSSDVKISKIDEYQDFSWKNVRGINSTKITMNYATGNNYVIIFTEEPKTLTINGTVYNMAKIEEPSENKMFSNDGELSYLQDSFELRYPDADDVGEDYGYLGMKSTENYFDYFTVYGNYYTTLFNVDVNNCRTITVKTKEGYKFGVSTYNNSTWVANYEWLENGTTINIPSEANNISVYVKQTDSQMNGATYESIEINNKTYKIGELVNSNTIKEPYIKEGLSTDYGLKRVIDWVGNCSDEEFVADFEKYFNKQYTLRYYLLVILCGMVDNLGKNMMFDTFDGQIWYPRFYDMDTICSYNNSGEIKFDVDIEMEQGYWNTSSSRLWTKVRDLMHEDLVAIYKDMRQNGVSYENFMKYFYGEQISKIPQTYYNKDFDVKYSPYADQYIGKAHGDGYQHLKRWLKQRITFCDTLFDYAPSYNNDVLTIRANTTDLMNLTIETYTPVYQHLSWYNGQMDKIKIDGKNPVTFSGYAQASTDQEVLIYGGSNIKKITGISSMNPNEMLIGSATRLTELVATDCPLLTTINSNKANLSPHTYLNKLDLSNCPQLGGTLRINNSQLTRDINIKGTAIDSLLLPPSIRNLETLRLPRAITSLTLNDAPLLNTLEFEEGNNLQSISLINCNALDNCINFDLTQVPKVSLDNSYNTDELYMSATTDLTLKNMSDLERVIYTPNNEYSEFDINNVLNAPNYKVTTFNNPRMTDFIVTAPHRYSYNGSDIEYREEIIGGIVEKTIECNLRITNGFNTSTGEIKEGTGGMSDDEYYPIMNGYQYTVNTTGSWLFIAKYDDNKNYLGRIYGGVSSGNDSHSWTADSSCYIRVGAVGTNITITIEGAFESIVETIIRKDYGDITPNTVFTANTLDLSDTQFKNVKFLCTTDVYNLKVPTSMKNFYCDSTMDVDTDVIVDGGYDVIHNELVEQYTTNYEGEVVRDIINTINIKDVAIANKEIVVGYATGYPYGTYIVTSEQDDTTQYMTDFIKVTPNTKITIPYTSYNGSSRKVTVVGYPADKSVGYRIYFMNSYDISLDYTVPEWMEWIKCSTNYDNIIVNYEGTYTPNLIPSSANGSLIFNMYSNNTTAPTSTSPYMWDLTGLKLNDFHTFGMNNWAKASDDSYEDIGDYTNLVMFNGKFNNSQINIIYYDQGQVNNRVIGLFQLDAGTHTFVKSNGDAPNVLSSTSLTGATTNHFNTNKVTTTETRYFLIYTGKDIEWLEIDGYRYYLDDIHYINSATNGLNLLDYSNNQSCVVQLGKKVFTGATSITMPQRMSGYSVRMVNADITPDNYATHLYPLLVDTTLPITGKLDYTKYNGNTLAWAYAYTTSDVAINPLDSQSQGNITNDYNKLYGTDYIDIVDVWVHKDTDVSGFSTNPNITKAYIELTSSNYQTRVDEVLQYYPNCKDLYFFEDGSMTTLQSLFSTTTNNNSRQVVENVTFMEGYFTNITSLYMALYACSKLLNVTNLPMEKCENYNNTFFNCYELISVPINGWKGNLGRTFYGCKSLNQQINIESATLLDSTFYQCTSLTIPPILPSNYSGTMANCFYGCTSLTTVPAIPDGVTSMVSCFQECTSLVSVPISGWKGAMSATFKNCKLLNQQINIESATALDNTFYGCTSLTTTPILPSSFTGSMAYCFFGCESLTTPAITPEGVTNMLATYQGCKKLTKSAYIPSGCTNVNALYFSCGSLKNATIPLANIEDYKSMLQYMYVDSSCDIAWEGERYTDFDVSLLGFYYPCSQEDIQELVPEHLADLASQGKTATLTLGDTYGAYLTSDEVFLANQKGWTIVGASSDFTIINAEDDVSTLVTNELVTSCFIELTSSNYKTRVDQVLVYYPNCTEVYFFQDGSMTTLESLFQSNSTYKNQLTKVTFVDGYFLNAYSMKFTFNGCQNLVKVVNPPKSTTLQSCFQNCYKLNCSFDFSDCSMTDNNGLNSAFRECRELTYAPKLPNGYSKVMDGCFFNCYALETIDVSNLGKVTNVASVFRGCEKVTKIIGIETFVTDGTTHINTMFNDCRKLTSIDTSGWDTSKVKFFGTPSSWSYGGMFENCESLTEIKGLDKWNFSSATDKNFGRIFKGCKSLTTIDLRSWDMSKFTDIGGMFENCSNLTSIDVRGWNVSNNVEYYRMFQNCPKLIEIKGIEDWDMSGATNCQYMYYSTGSLSAYYVPIAKSDKNNKNNNILPDSLKPEQKVIWRNQAYYNLDVVGIVQYNSIKLTQEHIQDLVPEHLADLHKDKVKISFNNKTITINDTNTTWE